MLVPLGLLLFSLVFGSEPKVSLKTWFEPKIRGYTPPPPPTNLRTEHKITRFLRFSSPMVPRDLRLERGFARFLRLEDENKGKQ
jgi:hypothetical protein